MYTVNQVANLAGVSVRTLHYYDKIGLFEPSAVGKNNYRYYADESLLRLQQILFYREMGLSLSQIKEMIDAPDFDLLAALQSHRHILQTKVERLHTLIATIDTTIMHLVGEIHMNKQQIFGGFTKEQQEQYEQEAMDLYDKETVKQSVRLWNSYSAEKKEQIKQEGQAIYVELAENMPKGADSPAVQALLVRWHQHLRHFYEPTPDILRGLGYGYNSHPGFQATFSALHPDLPAFLEQAINHYVDGLEKKAE